MTPRELMKLLKAHGCTIVRHGKGSHQIWQCGSCKAVIPSHPGDIAPGTLRSIMRSLEPCLGKEWWRK